MDMNGDLKIDLFGTSSTASSSSSFNVWQNIWNVSNPNAGVFNVYVYLHYSHNREIFISCFLKCESSIYRRGPM